VNSKRYSVLYL